MSAETSVPRPRESDVDISDSALFKGLLSEAEFAFAFFDAEGRIQRVNDVFSDVVNVPVDRMLGRQPVEVLAADLAQIITHAVQAVIEGDAPVTEGRVRVRTAEGDTRHWSLSFSPVHDDTGELRAMGFPVWTAHVSSQGTVKDTAGSVNVPVVLDGVVVNPGDVVVADDDGVTIVPRDRAAEALEASRARAEREAGNRKRYEAGEISMDINNLRPVLADLGVAFVTQEEYERGR